MQIRDCMKRNVVSIHASTPLGEAATRFVEKHIGCLPVVDDAGRLVGIIQLRDLLSLVMPDFVRLIEDFDFVHDFGAVEQRQPSQVMLAMPVSKVMHQPVSVEEDCGLLRAFSLLYQYNLRDFPVVNR